MNSLALDIEDDLTAALALNTLAEWVCEAQHTLERIRSAANRDPELDKLLAKHRTAIFSPGGSPADDSGLQWLQITIGDRLRAVKRIAGLERVLAVNDPASAG